MVMSLAVQNHKTKTGCAFNYRVKKLLSPNQTPNLDKFTFMIDNLLPQSITSSLYHLLNSPEKHHIFTIQLQIINKQIQ